MSSPPKKSEPQHRFVGLALVLGGVACLLLSIILFILIFGPVVKEEVVYDLQTAKQKNLPKRAITPVNTQFGIVIPKIKANAPIIKDVDPFNEKTYQLALSKGIAHAKGSELPDHTNSGTIFLFAHSAVNFYEANKYNAIFYLLNKLTKGDEIILYYQEKKFVYQVTETKIVNADQVSFLNGTNQISRFDQTLILMTCWPAGTSFLRLLVFATPAH